MGRKIRIFSLGRKNNILIKKKKSVVQMFITVANVVTRGEDPIYNLKRMEPPSGAN